MGPTIAALAKCRCGIGQGVENRWLPTAALCFLVAPLEQEHGQTKIDGYDENKQLDRISD